MNGVLAVVKPPRMTSHDVVAYLRARLHVRKAGHMGTLDPAATGVLVICLGKTTKAIQFVPAKRKIYRAEITLGISTDTDDATGTIRCIAPDFRLPSETVREVFSRFVGKVKQVPPMVSAIHYRGRRLYELAREGKVVDREARDVEIYDIRFVRWPDDLSAWVSKGDRILFDVVCSRGTYVRALCRDIGDALGCGAHMSFLLRIEDNGFKLEEAMTLEEIMCLVERGLLGERLIPMEILLSPQGPRINNQNPCFMGEEG